MKVWDLSTRLYHWSQAALFIALMISGKSSNGPHLQLGLALFALVLWRIIWGFIGSESSRFGQFLRSPSSVWQYLTGRLPTHLGHNPLGGWMVMALLTTLLLQCLSGMLLAGLFDNRVFATLLTEQTYQVAETVHLWLANLMPVLIALHVAAIVGYKLAGKGLLLAMLTGKQRGQSQTNALQFRSQWLALGVLMVASLITIAIIANA